MSETVLVLRTCAADMSSRNGFLWPESGPVECPDWSPEPVCGQGLHGALWGEGDAQLLSWDADARWLVVRVLAADVVDLDGKVKFPRGWVEHCGRRDSATRFLSDHGGWGRAIIGGTATAGDYGTATAGARGTAIAGYAGTATAGYDGTAIAGYDGTATAGARGTATAGARGTATAGDAGTATAGDAGTAIAGYDGTAIAGYGGTATAGDYGTATAGARGTATAGDAGTAIAGARGTATAGYDGQIRIEWWDGARTRLVVGYVGEDGVEPDVAYSVRDGVLVRAEP